MIPLKTEAGATEIRTRALKLDSRLRTLLIMIDGVKPIASLQATVGESAVDGLRKLRDMGLVTWDDSLSGQLSRPH